MALFARPNALHIIDCECARDRERKRKKKHSHFDDAHKSWYCCCMCAERSYRRHNNFFFFFIIIVWVRSFFMINASYAVVFFTFGQTRRALLFGAPLLLDHFAKRCVWSAPSSLSYYVCLIAKYLCFGYALALVHLQHELQIIDIEIHFITFAQNCVDTLSAIEAVGSFLFACFVDVIVDLSLPCTPSISSKLLSKSHCVLSELIVSISILIFGKHVLLCRMCWAPFVESKHAISYHDLYFPFLNLIRSK